MGAEGLTNQWDRGGKGRALMKLSHARFAFQSGHKNGILPLKDWWSPAARDSAAVRRIVTAARRRWTSKQRERAESIARAWRHSA